MNGAQTVLGVLPAFLLTFAAATVQIGLCEYRGKSCTAEWGFLNYLLGGGTIGGVYGALKFNQGYNTINPNLKRPEDDHA